MRKFLKALGPGLLMAGIAIGVSHLVQATRAGAVYGFQLIGVVLLINLVKYPFFEFGHRYAAARGESLLHGYARIGRAYLLAFLILQAISALAGVAAITYLTAALAEYLFQTQLGLTVWSGFIMGACAVLLLLGDYRWLDRCMKAVLVVLVLSTTTAFALACLHGPAAPVDFVAPSPWNIASIGFLLALMGWMPAPIEISVYQSLWVIARNEERGDKMSLREARTDFNFGYVTSTILALIFLALGALVVHGTGEEISAGASAFAAQLVGIYKAVLGGWSGPIIAAAAFTAMFSTTLTVIDANPRALATAIDLALPKPIMPVRRLRWCILLGGCVLELAVIAFFVSSLSGLVDLATVLAFLAGPVFAFLNYRLITSEHTPEAVRPGIVLRIWSLLGIAFFVILGGVFVVYRCLAA
jgi:Mn2+/Fe2+ NRAMP family transporter